MPLLNLKKKTVEKPAKVLKLAKKLKVSDDAPVVSPAKTKVIAGAITIDTSCIIRPRVTEKASFLIEKSNAYAFEISKDATSRGIKQAIFEMYKVKPVKIAFVPIRGKQVFVRGKWGRQKSSRKAYVYLKKGEKIEIA